MVEEAKKNVCELPLLLFVFKIFRWFEPRNLLRDTKNENLWTLQYMKTAEVEEKLYYYIIIYNHSNYTFLYTLWLYIVLSQLSIKQQLLL